MINLCLVVIATQFSETKRRETAKMKAERARFQSSSTLSSFTTSETTNCYRQILKLIAHLARKSFQKTRKAYKVKPLTISNSTAVVTISILTHMWLMGCHHPYELQQNENVLL